MAAADGGQLGGTASSMRGVTCCTGGEPDELEQEGCVPCGVRATTMVMCQDTGFDGELW